MRKEYELDIDKKSKWKIFTSSSMSSVLPFTIEECGLFHAKSEFFTEGEGINNYLLLYTLAGDGYCSYRNNKQILKPNSVIIIHCMEQFYVKPLESEWSYLWMHFNGSSMDKYMEYIMEEDANCIMLNDDRLLVKGFEELLNYPNLLDMNLSYYVSNIISNILTCIIKNKEQEDTVSSIGKYETIITSIHEYIEQHYMEDIGIEDFLEVAHLSKYYFIKIFKKMTGSTPYDYFIDFLISKSKILLRTTDESIADIAYKVGFPSVNNFIIQFKKNVGTTPNVYRRTQVAVLKDYLFN